MAKITSRFLKKWLQTEFNRLEIGYTVKSAYKTRFRDYEYENGAATYILNVGHSESLFDVPVYCYSTSSEIENALEDGKKLIWIPRDYKWIGDSTISIR